MGVDKFCGKYRPSRPLGEALASLRCAFLRDLPEVRELYVYSRASGPTRTHHGYAQFGETYDSQR